MSKLVWSFKKLPALNNRVGFIEVTDSQATTLLASGDVQDPKIGAKALCYIDGAYGSCGGASVTKPTKPTALTSSAITQTGFKATWGAVTGADKYTVSITPTVSGYPKDVTTPTNTFAGLTAGTAYTVKVKACNSAGCSADTTKSITTTAAPITKPAKVGTITETGVTKTEIKLDWAQVANAADYDIEITPTVATFPKKISVNTLALTGLTAATAYTIKIKACNTGGCAVATTKTVTTAT